MHYVDQVHRTFTVTTEVPADKALQALSDLSCYPVWMPLVSHAEPTNDQGDTADNPAWIIILKAKVGPLSRSKRLRMQKTITQPARVVFERHELDQKSHAAWTMTVDVLANSATSSSATIALSYEGPLWTPLLDNLLDSNARDAAVKLNQYLKSVD